MPERTSIYQTTQIGVESTPQTGVAAGKKFSSISIQPAIKTDISRFRVVGNKFATVAAPNREWTTLKITGQPTYDEIVYLLASALQYTAPVQQAATAAYKWTNTPALAAADAYKSYSIEQGDSVRAHKVYGCVVNDLSFTFARAGITMDGSMIGLALQDAITMTGAPTTLPVVPILPTQVDVKIADTQAGLTGASALTRCISASWSMAGRWATPWALGTAQTAWIAGVEAEPKLTAKLKVEADATGMGLLTQMRAGSAKFMRIKATGALIASTYYYDMQTDLSLKIMGEPGEFEDADGLYAIEWNFEAMYDATWTKTMQVDTINTQTAL
jgi:hypothetical protein